MQIKKKLSDNDLQGIQHTLVPFYDMHDDYIEQAGVDKFTPTTYNTMFQRTHGVTIVLHIDAQIPDDIKEEIADNLFQQIDQLNPNPQQGLFLLRVRVSDKDDTNYSGHYMPWVTYQSVWPPRLKQFIGMHRAGMIVIARNTIDTNVSGSALRTLQHELWHCIDDIFKQTKDMQTTGSKSQHKAPHINKLIMKHVMKGYNGFNTDAELNEWLKSGIIDAVMKGMNGYLKCPPEDFVHRNMAQQYDVEPYTPTAYYLTHGSHINIAGIGIEFLNAWDSSEREGMRYVPKQWRRQLAAAIIQTIDLNSGHRPALVKELKKLPATISKYFR